MMKETFICILRRGDLSWDLVVELCIRWRQFFLLSKDKLQIMKLNLTMIMMIQKFMKHQIK